MATKTKTAAPVMPGSRDRIRKTVFINAAGEEKSKRMSDSIELRTDFFKADGKTVYDSRSINFADFASLFPAEIYSALAVHGFVQKVFDSFAGAKDDWKGDATEGYGPEAVEEYDAMVSLLTGGTWNAGRGDGESATRTTILAEAVARVLIAGGKFAADDKDAALAFARGEIAKLEDAGVKALRAKPPVAKMIATIEAERAAAKLAKLEAAGGTDATGLDLFGA